MKEVCFDIKYLITTLNYDGHKGYGSASAQTALAFLRHARIHNGGSAPFGVHYRTLGNVAYLMSSLNTSSDTLRALEAALLDGL